MEQQNCPYTVQEMMFYDDMFLRRYTFCRCGIEEIVLPDSLESIPSYAFKDCKHLRKVVCGLGLKKISAWAFGGCDRMEELVHDPGVLISPQAFEQNEKIIKVEYE